MANGKRVAGTATRRRRRCRSTSCTRRAPLSRCLSPHHRSRAVRHHSHGAVVNFAREGLSFIVIAALIALGAFGLALTRRSWPLWLLAFALTVVALWVAYFFRDPQRAGRARRPARHLAGRRQGRDDHRSRRADVHEVEGDSRFDLHERVQRARQSISGHRHRALRRAQGRASSSTRPPRTRASRTSRRRSASRPARTAFSCARSRV